MGDLIKGIEFLGIPMTIAIIAAFILGEYPESAIVVLLFKLGEFLEEKAVENSNKNILPPTAIMK